MQITHSLFRKKHLIFCLRRSTLCLGPLIKIVGVFKEASDSEKEPKSKIQKISYAWPCSRFHVQKLNNPALIRFFLTCLDIVHIQSTSLNNKLSFQIPPNTILIKLYYLLKFGNNQPSVALKIIDLDVRYRKSK